MEGLKKQFDELQAKFAEQSIHMREQMKLLEQARSDQREALAMAKQVIEQRAPATVYIQRDRKCPDFSGTQTQGEMCVEEWIAAVKSYFSVCKSKVTLKLRVEDNANNIDDVFKIPEEVYGDKVPVGIRLREFYD